LQVTDTNGCISSDTLTISLFEPANANAGFNVSICPNQSILLTATGGVTYNWEPANFVNRPDTAIVLASPNDDMEFIVQVTDSNGCVDFDTMQVLVFIANTNPDTLICKGDSIQAAIFGDPATSFSWSPSAGVSDSSIYNPYLSPNITTSYIVDIENASGCQITDTLIIEVPDPVADFDTLINAGCDGVVVTYTNTSEENLSIEWLFSDGETSTENDIEKVFSFSNDFSATLLVVDEYGCTNSKTYNGSSLSFDDYFSIEKPNVFTPDGDGLNDQFIIDVPGKIYECTDLIIYNRWGQIQFISTGNNLSWDGRNNVGQIVPNGTYFYTLTVKDKSFNGSLSIYK
jgi:gliding motility-associated-like protein